MMFSRTFFALSLVAAAICISCDRVPLLAPVNSTLSIHADNTVLPIGGTTQVSAMVIEQAGTPVHDGTSVRFTTSLGRVDPVDALTRNGIAVTTFLAGDTSGLAEVRATSGAANGTPASTPSTPTSPSTPATTSSSSNSVMISVGTAAVETVTVRVNPANVSQNGGTVQVIATVTGANGRLLSGLPVSFSATRGTLSAGTAVTDSNGEARVILSTNSDTDVTATAGTKTSTAAKVTAQPGASVTLTCAVGSTNNCASVSTGDTATFTASRASTSSPIASSTLDFGDGQSAPLGTLSSPVQIAHRYNQAGTYTATITAMDINGETTTASNVITVTELLATISVNVTSPVTHTVQATATISAQGTAVARFEWQFLTDGNPVNVTTTTNTATNSFLTGGSKTVNVRVVLTDGRSAPASQIIQVP